MNKKLRAGLNWVLILPIVWKVIKAIANIVKEHWPER